MFALLRRVRPEKGFQAYVACGESVALLPENMELADMLSQMGIDDRFEGWQGAPDWDFWDAAVHRAMTISFDSKKGGNA